MSAWKPGDRVEHATFGTGTVIEFNERHAVIHFDNHGRRTFASHLVVLSESQRQARAPMARRSGTTSERATDVGYENLNEQVVLRPANRDSSLPGQTIHVVLKCRRCGTEYGTQASDIQLRRCPACMGGPPGLPV